MVLFSPWRLPLQRRGRAQLAGHSSDLACLCSRSPRRPAEPPSAQDSAATALPCPHPQPAPRGLHQLSEPGQLHSEEQPQPRPHGPLALWGAPCRRRPGARPRPGQLAAQQQHPAGDQVHAGGGRGGAWGPGASRTETQVFRWPVGVVCVPASYLTREARVRCTALGCDSQTAQEKGCGMWDRKSVGFGNHQT